eukprot:s1775_g6.t1
MRKLKNYPARDALASLWARRQSVQQLLRNGRYGLARMGTAVPSRKRSRADSVGQRHLVSLESFYALFWRQRKRKLVTPSSQLIVSFASAGRGAGRCWPESEGCLQLLTKQLLC